jgi:cation:H+ antiporter
MLHDALLLLAGLALIIEGGDLFVAAAVRLAGRLHIPRIIVGSTLVSLATTAPELTVSVMSGLKGAPGLAVGNAVGSVICNIGLIFGVTAAIKQVEVHPRLLRIPLLAMFGAGAVLFLMTLDLHLSHAQGAFLVGAGVVYFIWDFWRHRRERSPEAVAEAQSIKTGVTRTRFAWLQTTAGSAAQFVFGAALVLIGSRLLVDGAVSVAGRLGVPSILIGLTVVAVGTSLPELVTAIASSRQAVSDLALGNVLGANIANLTLVVGVAALVQQVTLDRWTQVFNFPAMLIVMAVLLWVLLTDRRVTRREGVVLLAVYGIYLLLLATLNLTAAR